MDRVGFLVESSGVRLGCLLNPETFEISRVSGVRPRQSAGGLLTGRGLRDDPLHFTGGGTTEVKMDLLFDVGLAGSSIQSQDVRDLTGPLWQLAENAVDDEGRGHLPLVRFVWGKAWNIPGVISAIGERFEDFSAEGIPRRSWVRVRFLRVDDIPTQPARVGAAGSMGALPPEGMPTANTVGADYLPAHELVGGPAAAADTPGAGDRLDTLAQRVYGDASLWRWLAVFNHIDDPLHIPAGQIVQIPPLPNQGEK